MLREFGARAEEQAMQSLVEAWEGVDPDMVISTSLLSGEQGLVMNLLKPVTPRLAAALACCTHQLLIDTEGLHSVSVRLLALAHSLIVVLLLLLLLLLDLCMHMLHGHPEGSYWQRKVNCRSTMAEPLPVAGLVKLRHEAQAAAVQLLAQQKSFLLWRAEKHLGHLVRLLSLLPSKASLQRDCHACSLHGRQAVSLCVCALSSLKLA